MMGKNIKTDALVEVINIGTGQAATALSKLLSQKVLIDIPDIKLLPINDLIKFQGDSNQMVVALYFGIEGDLGGKILIIFRQNVGHDIASSLTGSNIEGDAKLEELDRSSLMEMGNIVANAYLNGLAGLLDVKLFPSVPFYAEDMFGAVVDNILVEISQYTNYVLFINTELDIKSHSVHGSFMVFPDEKFMNKIFEKLGLSGDN